MAAAPATSPKRTNSKRVSATTYAPAQRKPIFQEWLCRVRERTEGYLRDELTDTAGVVPDKLAEAMQYACLSGGKRMRPALVFASAEAAAGGSSLDQNEVVTVAIGIEMIHAHSLVHDDLPCMDDDDLRRGKPTVHKAFDEATAILSGTAVLVRAFELLASPSIAPDLAARLIRELSCFIGWKGVIAGQVLDLEAEGTQASVVTVDRIHQLKTAALTEAACRCGAIIARADDDRVDALGRFGRYLGLAFQAVDDLLDETADEATVGKRLRKDRDSGKAALPGVVGLAEARSRAYDLAAEALEQLDGLGSEADALRAILDLCVNRDR